MLQLRMYGDLEELSSVQYEGEWTPRGERTEVIVASRMACHAMSETTDTDETENPG